ncbi:MAG TPA: hypothetical protein VD883_03695 [Candidatus Omnitrophota bacterium]|nr:hypothetical protein [Candidatus Omnitrophota bacterium]
MFSRAILIGAALIAILTTKVFAEDFLFSDTQADCVAQIIFLNECSGKEKNLLFWSPQEAFPSVGIGHFIWYPEGETGPYQESFPGYLDFAQEIGLKLPDWIIERNTRQAPWRNRQEFISDQDSDRVRELFIFLRDTKREQAHYILRRFCRVFPTLLDSLDDNERDTVQARYDLLIQSLRGAFAMIDYVNFKGEGFNSDARYNGQGWGLAHVLLEMKMPDDPKKALDEFVDAAERVLERRVAHAPRPDVESRWLAGWKNRLRQYRHITCG